MKGESRQSPDNFRVITAIDENSAEYLAVCSLHIHHSALSTPQYPTISSSCSGTGVTIMQCMLIDCTVDNDRICFGVPAGTECEM